MARKTGKEIEEIKKKYDVNRIWSWSRFNSYHNSQYEYFLKYILHTPEDRQDCIYTVTGGMSHDIMERLYLKKIEFHEMESEFEDAWLTAGIADLKFDRNDEIKNEKIKTKYYECLKHFFKNHRVIEHKIDIERFVTAKIGNNVFQGYIDACFKDENGCFNILDWKTSSIYKGKKAKSECGQLIVYAIALNQLGVPFDKIKICWDFLKYVSVQCEQANGKWTTREIERNEIGAKLQTSVKMWLKKLGYEDQILEYLDILQQTNSIESLPEDVQKKYIVSDCIVYVDITNELVNRWETEIVNTIDEIIEKENTYIKLKNLDGEVANKVFWESEESVEKQSYYFATLCAYSPNLHKPYQQYLDRLKLKKEETENMYSGVGADISIESEDDMSWLDQL